jgi:signal transduction histidine kinase
MAAVQAHLEGHAAFAVEYRVRRKDGVYLWWAARGVAIRTPDGKPLRWIGTVTDITERKRAEEALRETNLQLEAALAELKNAEEQVIQQERLNALGAMASGIAHDFNNSLTAVLGGSELLLSRPEHLEDKKTTRNYIEMMNVAAQDAGRVVNRLREFYRPREKNEPLAPLDLNEVVNQAVCLTQPKWKTEAEAKGISVNMHTDLQTVPSVAGNAAELREALTNLIFKRRGRHAPQRHPHVPHLPRRRLRRSGGQRHRHRHD